MQYFVGRGYFSLNTLVRYRREGKTSQVQAYFSQSTHTFTSPHSCHTIYHRAEFQEAEEEKKHSFTNTKVF